MGARADPVGALAAAWRVGRREYGLFLLLLLPALLVELGAGLAAVAFAQARGFGSDWARISEGAQMEILGVALPLYLVAFTLRLAAGTLIAARVLDVLRGGARLARWRALLAPSLLAGFVLLVTYVAGALLLLVGFFVMLHWFLYVPAKLAEGANGVPAAFEASRRFARERRTHGFTALVVLWGALAWSAYFALNALPGRWAVVAPALFAWLAGPVVPLAAAAFVAVGSSARAPSSPKAPQADGATSCPRCGTLIRYTPTGSPVDVVCPACQYAGRVL